MSRGGSISPPEGNRDRDPRETAEWLEAFAQLRAHHGEDRARYLLEQLHQSLRRGDSHRSSLVQTPYLNTIPVNQQPNYPGDMRIEKRIRAILRWNAAVMVHRSSVHFPGLGGHVSTYASA